MGLEDYDKYTLEDPHQIGILIGKSMTAVLEADEILALQSWICQSATHALLFNHLTDRAIIKPAFFWFYLRDHSPCEKQKTLSKIKKQIQFTQPHPPLLFALFKRLLSVLRTGHIPRAPLNA